MPRVGQFVTGVPAPHYVRFQRRALDMKQDEEGNQGLKVALAMLGIALVISAVIKLLQFLF